MRVVHTYTVVPALPDRLAVLQDIAYNLWWCWNQEARDLFIRLDRDLWQETEHNPVAMIGRLSQERVDELMKDIGFLSHMDRVNNQLVQYLQTAPWWDRETGGHQNLTLSYFCAEYGLHECLKIYSGGLGLLAGDHLKSASDVGLPLVAVGLFYYNGYFQQKINADGWQNEYYPDLDFHNLPATLECKEDGRPVTITVDYPGRTLNVQCWRIQVGRVPLYLLDTNRPDNTPEDRQLTARLYGGDTEHRLKQELLLGVGGMRMLRALNINPDMFHMNEGHAAFLALERMRELVEGQGMSADLAREAITPGNVFTTHTPVPAGHDVFGPDQIDRYFGSWYDKLKLGRKAFLALGRENPHNEGEPFSMTVLALRCSAFANGVSKLHGEVSRQMMKAVWPEVPLHEVPIGSVTNGVHIQSYLSQELAQLFDRYLGPNWVAESVDHKVFQKIQAIPDAELWRMHERRREHLVAFIRERLQMQAKRSGWAPADLQYASEALDPEALTIGFARRFATYKRGTLVFRDIERLAKIVNDAEKPVQFVFAGKAHPRDEAGKKFIQEIFKISHQQRFRGKVIFLEGYDINIARYLVQGVDVWLNNPRRPREASGTSGMKAAANGVLNCSILDGWWPEAYNGQNGWAIGEGEDYEDLDYQDQIESQALLDLIEKQIVPLFYDRGHAGMPRGWTQFMKNTMMTCIPVFNTHRQVQDYTRKYYLKAAANSKAVAQNNYQGARNLWDWKMSLYQKWAQIRIEEVKAKQDASLPIGANLEVTARINLGQVNPNDVSVQLYNGGLDNQNELVNGTPEPMTGTKIGDGVYSFAGKVRCNASGKFAYTIRILPHHPYLSHGFISGLITWG
ncbi:MAG TPA: alpha-glucan family phosphorylase [Planctomycetota bacterium]|nr:alpha-glucan family phosphorylase [Planctomycetota bacterium]